MIKDRIDKKRVIDIEKKNYGIYSKRDLIKLFLLSDHNYLLWKYTAYLRNTEYYYNIGNKVLYQYYQRKKNKLGARLGITIWHNVADEGLCIWHYGSVIVNGHAKIGKNCQLHGENCIGNKGDFDKKAPILGDNVDVGVGAKIIGDIYIANNVKIGANAVVTKSCYRDGAVLVGVPAREIK